MGEKRRIGLGVLFSRTGPYAFMSEACRAGVLAAARTVNADPTLAFSLDLVERDPGGNVDLYGPLAADLLGKAGVRHIVGCITSWSRKEVIPVLEKYTGALWYPCPYEGFEASDHVAYTHACPNQHLLPLLDWAVPAHGGRGALVGSNYIWGWEIGRLARETITAMGGTVLADRFLPIGSTDVGRMIEEVRHTRPDFVVNSLIGPSSYAFLAAMAALGRDDAHFRPDTCPILSCNLTEAELDAIGPAAEGLVSAGPYFAAPTDAPAAFDNSLEAAAHAAVMELARLLHSAGMSRPEDLTLPDLLAAAPAGLVDRRTHHAALPVLIAQVRDRTFRTIRALPAVAGDPYLTAARTPARPNLKVVS